MQANERSLEKALALLAAAVAAATSQAQHDDLTQTLAQQQVEINQITSVVRRQLALEGCPPNTPPAVSVSQVAQAVERVCIPYGNFLSGVVPVEFNIVASAHPGVLYLSCAQPSLDLGTASNLSISVIGPGGSVRLTFTSGTELRNLAAAINSWTPRTRVFARASGTGVVLQTLDFSADAFVTVRVIDDGDFEASGPGRVGLYTNESFSFRKLRRFRLSRIDPILPPVYDFGRDVQVSNAGSFNYFDAVGGSIAFARTVPGGYFGGDVRLSTDINIPGPSAVRTGLLRAFVVTPR